jgi:ribosomal protein L37AE/L43A
VPDIEPERWSPPADFVPVPSSEEGVLLWAPRPVEEDQSVHAHQTSKCPQCGASAAFDVKVGAMTCRFCGFTAESKAKTVGTAAQQNEFTLEAMALFDQGWGVERRELHCSECAANIAIEEGNLTATCPFCDSNQMNVQAATQTGIRPKFLIPFTVEASVVEGNLKKFLGQGWMFPGDLAPLAKTDRFSGIYLPFWVFDARIVGGWRAEIGHPHTVHYTENGKSRTRTEIRYR